MAGEVGARGILVRTGYGRSEEARPTAQGQAATVADNLIAAVAWILDEARRTKDQAPKDPVR
jgi:hypothetical protein